MSIERERARASRHQTSSYACNASQTSVTSASAASAGTSVATGIRSKIASAATKRPRLTESRRSIRDRIAEYVRR
ncbi:MAG: hypothetical protein ACXVRG_01605 [Gaiellaceae bacterium]